MKSHQINVRISNLRQQSPRSHCDDAIDEHRVRLCVEVLRSLGRHTGGSRWEIRRFRKRLREEQYNATCNPNHFSDRIGPHGTGAVLVPEAVQDSPARQAVLGKRRGTRFVFMSIRETFSIDVADIYSSRIQSSRSVPRTRSRRSGARGPLFSKEQLKFKMRLGKYKNTTQVACFTLHVPTQRKRQVLKIQSFDLLEVSSYRPNPDAHGMEFRNIMQKLA